MDRRAQDELSALMSRLKDGDRAAIRPAFDLMWPAVLARCAQDVGKGADAEDAAQQAIVKVFAQAHAFDPARPAWPWVAAIASFEGRSILRTRSRRRDGAPLDLEGAASTQPSPEDRSARRELERAAACALEALGEPDRLVLAEALDGDGPKDDAARKRKSRATQRLRAWFRRLHADS